ncbi:MAG: hypothetical protein JXM70_16565 [Pirellulales bacterium]|nr:hypothetical protein [Pirellulales bacterium]
MRRRTCNRNIFTRRLWCEPLEDRRMLSITLFVDDDAAPSGDGLAWASAYDDLQSALSQAAIFNSDGNPATDVDQIWIAEGTYKPTAELESGDARSASFSLLDGITLYGGFAGNEDTLAERDANPTTHETILSGDIGVPDDNSDNAFTVVYCGNDIEAAIDGISIRGGNADGSYESSHPERNGGGGIFTSGTLTVTNSILTGNKAKDGYGGGIENHGTATIIQSTLFGNSAHYNGGGINNHGTLTVTDSMLTGNAAEGGSGGGIYNYGTATITNSTLAGNSATSIGGGIYHASSDKLTVTNSTIMSNSANDGGGIGNYSGTLMLTNSIVCLNSGRNITGSFDGSNNLIDIDPSFVRAPSAGVDGDWGTDDDDLGDLRLTDRSPAINKGNNLLAVDAVGNPLTIDLAGNPRIADGTVDLGAYEHQGPPAAGRETPSLVVSAIHDEFDLYDSEITLREAIYYSHSGIGDGTVTFDAALDGETITLSGWELRISHSIEIDASALSSLTVDADNRSRAFFIESDVTLHGLTITGGSAGSGGGIHNDGTLTVTNSALTANSSNIGGGICNTGTLVVENTIIEGNSCDNEHSSYLIVSVLGRGHGGGICNISGTVSVANSMLSGNSAGSGGGIYNSSGSLIVNNSTIAGNTGNIHGGGIYTSSGTLTVTNSIVCLNSANNIEGDFGGSYNLINIDPNFVRAPAPGTDGIWGTEDDDPGDLRLSNKSLAINEGNNPSAVDATGNPLTTDLDGNPRIADATVDIGAYEYQGPPASGRETPSLLVSLADDKFDLYDGEITLREAIYYSQSGIGDGTVTFDGNLDGKTITLSGWELRISHPIVIDASALSSLTLDANIHSRVFYIEDDATLSGLTITGGSAYEGGGVYNDGGTLTINGSSLIGNSADTGGGIYNNGTLTLSNSMLSGNSAEVRPTGLSGSVCIGDNTWMDVNGPGGGIYSNDVVKITNSTFSGNSSESGGGAICSINGTLTVTNSTLSGNSAESYGGGICSSDGVTLTIANTILYSNVALEGLDYYGDLASESDSNLIGGDPLFVRNPSDGGDDWRDDPDTSEIDESANNDYGDLRLMPDSPAINAGDNSLAVDASGDPLETDLAGNPRILLGTADMGAYEYVPRIDFSAVIVTQRTALDANSEADATPAGADWIDEWQTFWVEIWVDTLDSDNIGVTSAMVDLKYNTGYHTATNIEYGPGFEGAHSGTIDDANGTVAGLGGGTSRTDIGDDRPALLARVRFEPTAADAGVPFYVDDVYAAAVENVVILQSPQAGLADAVPNETHLGTGPGTQLRAVPYDMDDDGQIGLSDLSFFASVYGEQPGVTTDSPYAYAADFDHSGTVDLGDLAFFASNYRLGRPNNTIAYPAEAVQSSQAGSAETPQATPTSSKSTRIPGDANLDNIVNDADAAIVASNWLMQSGATWTDGDFNKDGRVDEIDATILARNWQMTSVAHISGTKWNDLDGDGQLDTGEPGLENWKIFLDQNQNGTLDVGEKWTLTGADGSYTFQNLAAGVYTVVEVEQDGWQQTFPRYTASDEFQVNTYTTSSQSSPSVAVNRDGEFVVVWESLSQDGSRSGVYTQRFAADGTLLGSEFQVNTYTYGSQWQPSVTMNGSGQFVVAWHGSGLGGDDLGIHAQRYAADGTPLGSEFQVNTYTTATQSQPSVAMSEAGDFVIVWTSNNQDGDGNGVFAQRYAADGTPLGSEFQVNTFTSSYQWFPSVAMHPDGQFVVAWESDGQDGDDSGIYAQRYAADGTPIGSEFRVNTHTANQQRYPAAAFSNDGRFVIAWHSKMQDGFLSSIHAQHYAADGTPLGDAFQVNTQEIDDLEVGPSLAMDADGRLLVAWHADDSNGIFGRRYSPDGTPVADQFQVNTYAPGYQAQPSVAMNASGQSVVAWHSLNQDGSDYGIFARRYSGEGWRHVTVESGQHVEGIDFGNFAHIDYGDAPDPTYPTLRASNGAGHLVVNDGPYLGSEVDWESDAQPDAGALGDDNDGYDDEDGITFATELIAGRTDLGVSVVASKDCLLNAWMDFNADGDWSDAGEQIFADQSLSTGTNELTFTVPADATIGQTFARFRVNTAGGLSYDGPAADGEVEDYQVEIVRPAEIHGSKWHDQDGDGIWDEGEPGLEGWTIYLDEDNDGNLDPGEPFTTTDVDGSYEFTNLPAGVYTLNELRQDCWTHTFPEYTPSVELRCNTYTSSDQAASTIAMSAGGEFVVMWESEGQHGNDGYDYDIYGQLFAADGSPRGNEFLVDSQTNYLQRFPSVAMAHDGTFVAVWQSNNLNGLDSEIRAQRFASDGTPQGGEFGVNTYTTSDQTNPTVAMNANGDFVVAWVSRNQDGDRSGIYAQRYAADGTPLGSEFQVNIYTPNHQWEPSVAIDASGNFVIAWAGEVLGDSWGVSARLYAADGTPMTDEFLVNTDTLRGQEAPSVAMNATGQFVIAWESNESSPWYTVTDVFARRFASDGTPLGNEFRVNTLIHQEQGIPCVAINDTGEFIVCWQSGNPEYYDFDVHAQRFAFDETPLGEEFQVSDYPQYDHENPSVVMNNDGDFIFAWDCASNDGSGYGVAARIYGFQGWRNISLSTGQIVDNIDFGNFCINPPADDASKDADIAILAHHWLTAVEDLDGDKEENDARRAVFADEGALLGLLDET